MGRWCVAEAVGILGPPMTASRTAPLRPRVLELEESVDEPPPPRSYECDACGETFEGTPGGAGLLVWTRGDDVRYEEPPLCEACAAEISVGALMRWAVEEEEEG